MNIAEIVSNDRKVKIIINDDVKDMYIIKLATRCNILHSPPTFMIIIVLMSILKVMMRPSAHTMMNPSIMIIFCSSTHLYFIFHLLRKVFPRGPSGQVLWKVRRRRREVAWPPSLWRLAIPGGRGRKTSRDLRGWLAALHLHHPP